jgi:aminoglycoside/choline kinase family phosphotransferase
LENGLAINHNPLERKRKNENIMKEINIVAAGYKELFGGFDLEISALPESGSYRKYFRIIDGSKSVIGAYNADAEENEAFIGFSNHFIFKGLPVPEIFGYVPEKSVYFLRDLGDINMFKWLQKKYFLDGFDNEVEEIYRKVLDKLVDFQIIGIDGLDLDLCYPHRSFDRQSMMWDLNYFKYMLLKLLAVPFSEKKLEHDFDTLVEFLLKAGQDYFLYRDFQSANVMIINGDPWFIDYQGGRKGAPQYDVASLLFDAKAHVPPEARMRLLNYYMDNFCARSGEDREKFSGYFAGFSMIRLMQALGAFGFRGLYEKKPTFTGSIVPAVNLLNGIIDSEQLPVDLPELFRSVKSIPDLEIFQELQRNSSI